MPATQITFDNKGNFAVQPAIPTDQKVSAADVNAIKNAINTNADLLDTNTADIATNTGDVATILASLSPIDSASTAINLTNNIVGAVHSASGAAMPDTAFTLAASPVGGGFAVIVSDAISAPTIAGSTADSEYVTQYEAGSGTRLILVSYIAGTARHQLTFA